MRPVGSRSRLFHAIVAVGAALGSACGGATAPEHQSESLDASNDDAGHDAGTSGSENSFDAASAAAAADAAADAGFRRDAAMAADADPCTQPGSNGIPCGPPVHDGCCQSGGCFPCYV